MQTFLPVPSFVKSCEFLDRQRLGKQRIEAAQILEVLLNIPILPNSLISVVPFDRTVLRWSSHPAVEMWSGYEEWLKFYLACAIGEWDSRGYHNSIVAPSYDIKTQQAPSWLGDQRFHESHRSNLIRKLPSVYHKFWPEQNPCIPYFWPTREGFAVAKTTGGTNG